MALAGQSAVRAAVRVTRAPLGADPALSSVAAAIAGEPLPFLLRGRWALPDGAGPEARSVIAGVAPAWSVPAGGDPFAAFDDVPALAGQVPAPGVVGGGLVGWLGYDLGRDVERTLGPQPWRPRQLAAARLAWYDDVLRRDEHGQWWVEALEPAAGEATSAAVDAALERWRQRLARADAAPMPAARLGPMAVRRGAAVHRAAIAETLERIAGGELFQANICVRLEGELEGPVAGLAARVLEQTDPRYGGWIDGGAGQGILSSSPELFLRRTGRAVSTGPIKGTALRAAGALDPATDRAATALLGSEKDHAEHVMIVDLMRNDLGRVCDYGSVRYEPRPRIEPHAGVWHLVSEVGGRLHDGLGDANLLRATFPPGSVTGAPKVQAMRVIAAVEGTGREVYTGAHGLASPVSGLELAVTIRTLEFDGAAVWAGAGGGIVADSEPEAELREALGKAGALVVAAGGSVQDESVAGPRAAIVGVPWLRSDDRRPDPRSGLLETMRVVNGAALHAGLHLERLEASIRALGFPASPRDLSARIADVAAQSEEPARLRVLARPGGGALAIELQRIPQDDAELDLPIPLAPFVLPGGLGPHKWLDRQLVDRLTARLGASPLLLDADGAVLETGWANLWWEEDGLLCTPPLDGRQLPGVMRALVLEGAAAAGLTARETTRCYAAEAFAGLPLLLTSARGVSVAVLPQTTAAALARATELAAALTPAG